MPFKNFGGEEGEARSAFGLPLSDLANPANGQKSVEFDIKQGDVLPLRSAIPDSSLQKPRNKSPSRGPPAQRGSSPSPLSLRPSSPFPVLPVTNGISSGARTSPLPNIQDPDFHREAFPTNRIAQKSLNAIDNNFSKSSSNLHTQGIHKLGRSNDRPAVAQTHSTSEIVDPKSRHSSAPEQTSRLFASAIYKSGAVEDSSSVSVSGGQLRDELAKGRRLRRFNDLPAKSSPLVHTHTENQSHASDQIVDAQTKGGIKFLGREVRENTPDHMTDVEGPDGGVERDWQSTEPILGVCPDMCPESEREERERKGDLDKLERVDGDRNQTSKDLAVKKYTRTAEKLSSLIRPIPVLLKTMEHLLHLLDRGYDDELLNLHNFLWDRMRAVRMDLRMQHIFNQQAVVIHEQMIRFHILAMHELCEYAKGEGFTEGFDAHLNIEQMNKASVDLFHMYDDLRKAGNSCSSEAEFRGYYALLKLDKHPGYLVEPAELSLDLAKMTPAMRNTPEVQFARRVARACRLGNYLAFFRLARDATYLQACLMHAHFSKLRSQAMASLHSGLQRNQGIPLLQVADWLGLEGEGIEAIVEYHGFSVKNYEEPYIVKDGPFLNLCQDFPTRHSSLVEEKRSQKIRDDVMSSGRVKVPSFERISSLRRQSEVVSPRETAMVDEEMPDYEEEEQTQQSLRDLPGVFPLHPRNEASPFRAPEMQVHVPLQVKPNFTSGGHTQASTSSKAQDENERLAVGKRRKSPSSFTEDAEFDFVPNEHLVISKDKKLRTNTKDVVPVGPRAADLVEVRASVVQPVSSQQREKERQEASQAEAELERVKHLLKVEADLGKVRIWLRKWRARAAIKAEERQWRQQKLDAALDSFHVGLPLQPDETGLVLKEGLAVGDLDFDQTESMRLDKIERMWRTLDVTEVVSPVIKQRNPSCKFLCWKLLVCSSLHNGALTTTGRVDNSGEWLLSKILRGDEKGLSSTAMLSDGTYVASRYKEAEMPFFYIARDVQVSNREMQLRQAMEGASGVVFLVSETAPMSEERGRLHTLVDTLDDCVRLPLLVLYSGRVELINKGAWGCVSTNGDTTTLAKFLDMNSLDQSKIACWSVLCIIDNHQGGSPFKGGEDRYKRESRGFYSEELLKEGLSWLASKAPLQPNLRSVHIQDLVRDHLRAPFKALLDMELTAVSPSLCVKAFNEAILKTANEIITVATSSPPHWPPHELRQAFKKPTETWLLPSLDWNDAAYLHPIVEALSFTQLPEFPWKTQNLGGTLSLMQRKAVLEDMLHEYMNQISGSSTNADRLTLQVVDAIIQKACMFKQTAAGRLFIPNWTLIFQQFYHARLTLLSSEPPAIVWVQVRAGSHEGTDMMMYPDLSQCPGPTLDEMIQLEAQEVLLQQKKEAIRLMKDRDEGQSAAWMVPWMNASEVARHGDGSEEVQNEVTSRMNNTKFEGAITPVSKAELELESMVDKFCRQVDQAVAEAMEMEGGEGYQEQQHQGDQYIVKGALMYQDMASNSLVDCYVGNDITPCSHSWAAVDTMDSLAQLLQHCEHVQHSIDKTLRECFRIGGAAAWH